MTFDARFNLFGHVDFYFLCSTSTHQNKFNASSLYIVDPRGLEPPHFRLKGGYSTIELRIHILRIHLRLHCKIMIAITTVGYTIPIRAPCIHEIISMDTRHPLQVIFRYAPAALEEKSAPFKSNAQILPQSTEPISVQPAPNSVLCPKRDTNTRIPHEGKKASF